MPGCGGARGAAAVPAKTGGVEWWQWGRALLITSTARARHVHTGIRGCSYARAYLQAQSPGFDRGKGPQVCGWRGNRVVPMQVPVGAGLLVPAGVLRSAGRSRSPWPGPQRLGAALKQVFILEFAYHD